MSQPELIDLAKLKELADGFIKEGKIDDTANLKDAPVHIFATPLDNRVAYGVSEKLIEQYKSYGANVKFETRECVHAFPTDLERNKLDAKTQETPFIINCGYDGAGEIFKHIFGADLAPRVEDWKTAGKVIAFDQSEFVDAALLAPSNLDTTGYLFIPEGCQPSECKVHVALHGCQQGKVYIEQYFVENTGYLEWAAANKLIVIFP
mmetsp:Transcript_32364/g.49525  ORF Transcript_32364/g.49525 Transcript_32364/m.49525 type:complete len:206 (-) Transcript_32364:131-748(-)